MRNRSARRGQSVITHSGATTGVFISTDELKQGLDAVEEACITVGADFDDTGRDPEFVGLGGGLGRRFLHHAWRDAEVDGKPINYGLQVLSVELLHAVHKRTRGDVIGPNDAGEDIHRGVAAVQDNFLRRGDDGVAAKEEIRWRGFGDCRRREQEGECEDGFFHESLAGLIEKLGVDAGRRFIDRPHGSADVGRGLESSLGG